MLPLEKSFFEKKLGKTAKSHSFEGVLIPFKALHSAGKSATMLPGGKKDERERRMPRTEGRRGQDPVGPGVEGPEPEPAVVPGGGIPEDDLPVRDRETEADH